MMTKDKAKMMLKEGMARGHALTDKQKSLMRGVAHGWKPTKMKKSSGMGSM